VVVKTLRSKEGRFLRSANTKSLVAGTLLLMMTAKNVFLPARSPASTLHISTLVLCPVVSAICFWHAFQGGQPLLGKSEEHTSVFLGALSTIMALGIAGAWLRHHQPVFQLLTAVVFGVAAVFFFSRARRERHSTELRGPT
jgi:cytochrome bd-type quinol oxidase subunit 2